MPELMKFGVHRIDFFQTPDPFLQPALLARGLNYVLTVWLNRARPSPRVLVHQQSHNLTTYIAQNFSKTLCKEWDRFLLKGEWPMPLLFGEVFFSQCVTTFPHSPWLSDWISRICSLVQCLRRRSSAYTALHYWYHYHKFQTMLRMAFSTYF